MNTAVIIFSDYKKARMAAQDIICKASITDIDFITKSNQEYYKNEFIKNYSVFSGGKILLSGTIIGSISGLIFQSILKFLIPNISSYDFIIYFIIALFTLYGFLFSLIYYFEHFNNLSTKDLLKNKVAIIVEFSNKKKKNLFKILQNYNPVTIKTL